MPYEIMSDGASNGYDNKPRAPAPQTPSLAEMAARMRAKKRQEEMIAQMRNGAAPADARGVQQTVSLPGEAPIQAQPVSGPRTIVSVGDPRIVPMDQQPGGMRVTVGDPRIVPMDQMAQQPAQPTPINPQASMDPRAARLRALMGQGMSFEQAMRAMQQGT